MNDQNKMISKFYGCKMDQGEWRYGFILLASLHRVPHWSLRAIHSCQHLNECTKLTFSADPSPPSRSVHINIFQMIICHKNDKRNRLKCWKCMESTNFFIDRPPLKEIFFILNVDNNGWRISGIYIANVMWAHWYVLSKM